MKIGLVLEHFDPQRGGLENWTWQFAERLEELGHEVHVIACDFASSATGRVPVLHPVEYVTSPVLRAARFEQVLRSLRLDVIHDMGCGWYADLYHPHGGSTRAFREHNLMRIPRWRQIRFWRERRYREQAEIERRELADPAALVVAVSQMVLEHFHALHGIPRERLRLIHNGVDEERFSPQHCAAIREASRRMTGASGDETVFLLVAHNLRLKNAESAIRALAVLAAGGAPARLVIAGGKRPGPFVELARKLGISDRVTFLEALGDIRPCYAAADVCVHPTWYDPCSLVAIEALACGLPLITTRFNGVSELMTDGEEGFLLADPADVAALAEKMRVLLDPALRSKMGASARRLAGQHSLNHQTGRFLALYQEVVSRKNRAVSPDAGP
ncbi:MAG: glycosyltransferase family 4 protein [Verrucomicrobia bacterium]|nr:glycosyltransferase family 4 protein [Verrucomicrobiota bacterium]